MASTFTNTEASTFTEARARAVMVKIFVDFTAMKNAGLISAARADNWHEVLLFGLYQEAIEMFQVAFTSPAGQQWALDYQIKDDGSVATDQRPGGNNYAVFPQGTSVCLTVRMRQKARGRQKVLDFMKQHGWGMEGTILTGDAYVDRQYSQNGYGVTRTKVGEWK
ncbi:HORMA-1 domain-containing protein [Nannocystis bainbridge]|uniref:Bacterial HORMA domain-containing protein n=1 Tax=Nannocystis bainbridge TaxID=2995303 RepID=A0ABT5E648_9BACT|nr:hypothetical protein [Nannocystis bainbridge]MDC0721331.1 hypothetical protein [Nannocystis bainbridge]